MVDITTTKEIVRQLLEQNPQLRKVNDRDRIWLLAKQFKPNAKPSTVIRCISYWQNQMGLYLPDHDDKRYEAEKEYREYFR